MQKETLKDKVIFITGGSRGIGQAIALRAAQDGAKIVIAAKTDKPHPMLPGTIHSVAKEIEAAGGKALPVFMDVREESAIEAAVLKTVETWGGIDILINNASAIALTNTEDTPVKRYDLMQSVNTRGTFLCSKACIPYLKKSKNPHILTLSPPLNMQAKWFKDHLAYTISKYGMSMCTLGMAEELKQYGIAVNSLWPRTTIATAAIQVNFPKEILNASRKPQIMADAALEILTSDSRAVTGNFFIDEELLKSRGTTDFEEYALNPKTPLFEDLFLN
ncbi:MAG TPA: NAD(P)-dependent oxidoreductase [Gammaproteobacteria bacterium]|jgi:citronellol/citronellal dehydrogenase|nr:NAD(P)-dependent oxidoreductase [Gammaproteobacteria bacterium]